MCRLHFPQKRFQKDPSLREKYCKTLNDYDAKGHVRNVPVGQIDPSGKPLWYLLHHSVIHEHKPDKVQVVFDCTTLWEDGDLTKNPVDYHMLFHLFGASSSPCFVSFALKKTAKDFGGDFDAQTVDTVNCKFYVDDCLKFVATVPEASRLANQLVQLLAKGGFHLSKWTSNSCECLEEIPPGEIAPAMANLDLKDLPIDRTLGTQWDVEADTLNFHVKEKPVPDTRRGIPSLISSLYDPLGFPAPLILPAKVLLQELCRLDFGWDETVPNKTLVKWRAWVEDLSNLKLVSWPHRFKCKEFRALHNLELHHFSDASEVGYGAASNLRLIDDQGRIHCGLVMAKSHVAPLKAVTIPRMELTAAVVSVKLHKFITEQLDLPINRTVFWTNSTILLQYIRNEAKSFQTFVTNRPSIIHDTSSLCQWSHVDLLCNPADCTSRGFSSNEAQKSRHWFNGPVFLDQEDLMILPSKHHVTNLIIRDCHKRGGHVGASQVLASARAKFWILRGHMAVRCLIRKCLKCHLWNARPCEQIMTPLPSVRVSPCLPPFSSVSMDYVGLILVKSRRSQVKRYRCVFTCLAMQAVHIEIAHELTTDSVIQVSQDPSAGEAHQLNFTVTMELTLKVLRLRSRPLWRSGILILSTIA